MRPRDSDGDDNWPWDQPPNAAAITVASILDGAPILHVAHDADDDGWQFLDGQPVDVGQGRLIAMRAVVRLDPSIRDVADLPPGWVASRDRVGGPWTREVHPPDDAR
jgi:hypothetical protein